MLAALLPKRVKPTTVTSKPSKLRDAGYNVAIVRRQQPAHLQESFRKAVRQLQPFRVDDVVDTRQPHTARNLSEALLPADLAAAVNSDAHDLARTFLADFGYQQVHVRLEVVVGQLCSRWHADTVGMRCLVTYAGPGTQYVDNRHVKRRWELLGGRSEVVGVEEQEAQQAGAGDWLFLKGHMWPGNAGLGAVHRSPEADQEMPRLLLTVDDVLPSVCSCGQAGCAA